MNINQTPPNPTPRIKLDHSKTGPNGPSLFIQSPEKDDLIWKKIVRYLAQQERTVEEEYLLIEQKKSKLPSIQRLYIEIYINYNIQAGRKIQASLEAQAQLEAELENQLKQQNQTNNGKSN